MHAQPYLLDHNNKRFREITILGTTASLTVLQGSVLELVITFEIYRNTIEKYKEIRKKGGKKERKKWT